MAIFNIYYSSGFYFILLFFLGTINGLAGQGNCLIYPEDSGERIACELSHRAVTCPQGSRESQVLFDAAIRIGPNYAWAYYEKSVPFFKRGLLAEGVRLINKAIELEPRNYLYYRAYWYFYNRSYALCIRDLEELYSVHNASYVFTPSGELEMRLLLALAYAQTGAIAKGIEWIRHMMDSYREQPALKGYYDHFCLGLLYYENGQLALAQAELEQQLTVSEQFADTYYYLGLVHQQLGNPDVAIAYFRQAVAAFKGEDGGYSVNFFADFNTYLEDVERALLG
ncbi:MAG: tetratricopeptide repeat protein [Bacteroidota bacterium]